MAKLFAGGDKDREKYVKTIPLERMGTKWDIAMAVTFLSSAQICPCPLP